MKLLVRMRDQKTYLPVSFEADGELHAAEVSLPIPGSILPGLRQVDVPQSILDRLKATVGPFVLSWPDGIKAAPRVEKCGGPGSGVPGPCAAESATTETPAEPAEGAGRQPAGSATTEQAITGLAAAGALAKIGSMTWEALKAAGGKIGDWEHVAKEFVADHVGQTVAKLPESVQPIVRGAWTAVRMGSAVAFATYTAGQKAAEMVARERGASEEEASTLRHTLSTVDIALAKPVFLGLELSGLGAVATPASFVPVGSMSYLAYSTARDPMATLRAAGNAVKGVLGRKDVEGADLAGADFTSQLLDAIQGADDHDWFMAVYMVALDETQDANEALRVAKQALQSDAAKAWHFLTKNDCHDELGRFCGGGEGAGNTAGELHSAARAAWSGTDQHAMNHIEQKVREAGAKRGGIGVKGLKTIAKALELKGHSSLKKDGLIQAVQDKLGSIKKQGAEKDLTDRLDRVDLAEKGTGIKFNDRVVNQVIAQDGTIANSPRYKEAYADLRNETPKAENLSYMQTLRDNVLRDIKDGKVNHDAVKEGLAGIAGQGNGRLSVDEFKQRLATGTVQAQKPQEGILPHESELRLAPAPRGGSRRSRDSVKGPEDYIDRLKQPAFDRIMDIKDKERTTGTPFTTRVLGELLADRKVTLPGKDEYQNLARRTADPTDRLSAEEERHLTGFRDMMLNKIKYGDIPAQRVDRALERLDNQGHGTMHLDEFTKFMKFASQRKAG
jgi:hypothetical protein